LNGALHIPVYQLKSRMPEVLEFVNKHPESDVVVNCKTGVRARLAASILHCHVVQPVTVLNEVFDKLKEKGVDVVPYENK
jgi:rhodanese-related sulfurtransferase